MPELKTAIITKQSRLDYIKHTKRVILENLPVNINDKPTERDKMYQEIIMSFLDQWISQVESDLSNLKAQESE